MAKIKIPEGYALVKRQLTTEAWKKVVNADIWPVRPQTFQKLLDVLTEVGLADIGELEVIDEEQG